MGDSATRKAHVALVNLMRELQETGRDVTVHTVDGESVYGAITAWNLGDTGLVTVDRGGQRHYIVARQITRIDEKGDSKMVAFG